VGRLSDITASHAPLAWLAPYTERMKASSRGLLALTGCEKNRTTLRLSSILHSKQGVCHRRLELEELFPNRC